MSAQYSSDDLYWINGYIFLKFWLIGHIFDVQTTYYFSKNLRLLENVTEVAGFYLSSLLE